MDFGGVVDTFLSAFLGGFLGILLMIPFHRNFVAEMHVSLPFPEGTATNEILKDDPRGIDSIKDNVGDNVADVRDTAGPACTRRSG